MIFSKTMLAKFARTLPALALGGIALANPDLVSAATAPNFSTGTQVLTDTCGLIFTIKEWMFNIVYILGAIGLVLIAISAFLGRFKFSHLIALGGGLFVVAAADLLITFITGSSGNTTC